jgi:hypothetical protein
MTSSLRRWWICRLQLLLVLASAVILRSESRGTHDHIYCLRFKDPPTWRAMSSYLYPPGTGRSSYTPRHWVPFSSPPTTRRATVEVFEPASTRVPLLSFHYILSTIRHGSHRKHSTQQFFCCYVRFRCRESVSTEPLSGTCHLFWLLGGWGGKAVRTHTYTGTGTHTAR